MNSPTNRIACPTCGGVGELQLGNGCGDPEHCPPTGLCSTCDGDGELLIERWEKTMSEPHGRLIYRSIDGSRTCWPGMGAWIAADMIADGDVLDLFNMRAQMIVGLQKIEKELDERGLMDRLT